MKSLKIIMTAFVIALGLLSFTKTNRDKNENPKRESSSAKGYEVGDEAADFKLKNIDGKMVSLSDFKKAKGFIIVFTCNHCPYAKKYEDRIVALDKRYESQGYPVIAINPNDPNVQPEDGYQQMITRAKEKGFTFPYLLDEGQKIYPQYGATKTPHVFVLQKENGKNIVKYIGAVDNNYEDPNDVSERYVEDAVDALVKNQPIKMNKTVAIGCTIKVKK
ncbi:thioredoxin family protein [Chryseobacterium chendengshani]|uniref:thioredoxin family protein n=1 Tax=Chryseobacterium sp. LJ668 TaxID=2864040 RepID=UPI001C689589|nr:thioredoxin family protein [Chryseobacterium sp. LJ668]MBW8522038.1 thioredoxin family protein [Chryseobacterium sp. LJ668]QYK17690.1 thioredoxin family protein [Chryseobacterium sp. LJ668]